MIWLNMLAVTDAHLNGIWGSEFNRAGDAPFLVSHPTVNAWITARETALAQVR
jgi:hypothetical protein